MISAEQANRLLMLRRSRGGGDPLLDGLVIYHPLTSLLDTLPTGQTVTASGTDCEAGTYQGIPCLMFSTASANYISVPFSVELAASSTRRISFSVWFAKNCTQPNQTCDMLSFADPYNAPTNNARMRIFFAKRRTQSDRGVLGIYNGSIRASKEIVERTDVDFHNLIFLLTMQRTGTARPVWTMETYLDGVDVGSMSVQSYSNLSDAGGVYLGTYNTSQSGFVAYSALRVWERHLTAAEIAQLAAEFTPQT